MKLGDVYINKDTKELIQIDSFASHMGKFWEDTENNIVIFRQLENHGGIVGSLPSFNGYGTSEEIEAEYDLLISQEELNKYSDWNDIFELIEHK